MVGPLCLEFIVGVGEKSVMRAMSNDWLYHSLIGESKLPDVSGTGI